MISLHRARPLPDLAGQPHQRQGGDPAYALFIRDVERDQRPLAQHIEQAGMPCGGPHMARLAVGDQAWVDGVLQILRGNAQGVLPMQ